MGPQDMSGMSPCRPQLYPGARAEYSDRKGDEYGSDYKQNAVWAPYRDVVDATQGQSMSSAPTETRNELHFLVESRRAPRERIAQPNEFASLYSLPLHMRSQAELPSVPIRRVASDSSLRINEYQRSHPPRHAEGYEPYPSPLRGNRVISHGWSSVDGFGAAKEEYHSDAETKSVAHSTDYRRKLHKSHTAYNEPIARASWRYANVDEIHSSEAEEHDPRSSLRGRPRSTTSPWPYDIHQHAAIGASRAYHHGVSALPPEMGYMLGSNPATSYSAASWEDPDQHMHSPPVQYADPKSRESSLQQLGSTKMFNAMKPSCAPSSRVTGQLYRADIPEFSSGHFTSPSKSAIARRPIPPTPQSMIRPSRKRYTRTVLTEEQITVLKASFDRDAAPLAPEISQLASELDLPPKVVRIWFQNRRARHMSNSTMTPPAHESCASSSA